MPRLSYANVTSTLALFLALGGGAVAATKFVGRDGSISGCVSRSGALTVKKPGARCGKGQTRLKWSQKGPAGVNGAQGAQGEPGLQGPKGDTGPSTGPAGGDLTGNYPNPSIAAGAVTAAKVAANSLTGESIDETTLSGVGSGVMTGRLNALSQTVVNGGPPTGTSTGSSAVISAYQTMSPSVDTVARDFSIRLSTPPGAGTHRAIQFVVSGLAVPICTLADTDTTCTVANPIDLPANTSFSIQEIPTGSPATADMSFGYRLVTP